MLKRAREAPRQRYSAIEVPRRASVPQRASTSRPAQSERISRKKFEINFEKFFGKKLIFEISKNFEKLVSTHGDLRRRHSSLSNLHGERPKFKIFNFEFFSHRAQARCDIYPQLGKSRQSFTSNQLNFGEKSRIFPREKVSKPGYFGPFFGVFAKMTTFSNAVIFWQKCQKRGRSSLVFGHFWPIFK